MSVEDLKAKIVRADPGAVQPPLPLRPPSRSRTSCFSSSTRITGSFGSPLSALGRALDRIASGVRPVIDTVYPLAEFRAGLARLEARDVFGKILVEL